MFDKSLYERSAAVTEDSRCVSEELNDFCSSQNKLPAHEYNRELIAVKEGRGEKETRNKKSLIVDEKTVAIYNGLCYYDSGKRPRDLRGCVHADAFFVSANRDRILRA